MTNNLNIVLKSFFRTIGRFLAIGLISLLTALLFHKLGFNPPYIVDIVKAETNANYSSIRMDVEQCSVRPNGTTTAFNNCVWDHTNGLGSNYKISFGSANGYLRKIQFQFFGGSNYTYPAGSYRVQFQIAQDPLDMLAFTDYYDLKIYGNNTSSSSGASSGLDTITSKSCVFSRVTTYRVAVNCAFTTSRDLKYLNVSFEYYDDNDVKLYNTNAIQWESIDQFVYSTDSTGAINNQTTIIQNEFTNLTDTLTDDSPPDVDELENMAGWLPPGPVDSILNLPLTYLNSLSTALGGTCSVVQPTLPFINEQIELPCIKTIYNAIGAMNFLNWVGYIVSAFILFRYFMNLYKWVDDTLTFRENNYIDNWAGGE